MAAATIAQAAQQLKVSALTGQHRVGSTATTGVQAIKLEMMAVREQI